MIDDFTKKEQAEIAGVALARRLTVLAQFVSIAAMTVLLVIGDVYASILAATFAWLLHKLRPRIPDAIAAKAEAILQKSGNR